MLLNKERIIRKEQPDTKYLVQYRTIYIKRHHALVLAAKGGEEISAADFNPKCAISIATIASYFKYLFDLVAVMTRNTLVIPSSVFLNKLDSLTTISTLNLLPSNICDIFICTYK